MNRNSRARERGKGHSGQRGECDCGGVEECGMPGITEKPYLEHADMGRCARKGGRGTERERALQVK